MQSLIKTIGRIPWLGPKCRALYYSYCNWKNFDTASYWETRYGEGGTSGAGSYGPLAEYKAQVINDFLETNSVQRVIELGCGDGAQLSLAAYPNYVGVDVSESAIEMCRKRFREDSKKAFYLYSEFDKYDGPYDLSLSLDVVYHLFVSPNRNRAR